LTIPCEEDFRAWRSIKSFLYVNHNMNMAAIAREVGVSAMTVSRALRNDPRVSPELAEKIRSTAERLGYRPNPLVSALMSQRRRKTPSPYEPVLGFVTRFQTRDGWKRVRLYREFFDGAGRTASKHGYQLQEFWLGEPGMTSKRLSQVLRTRSIHGLILAPLPEPRGRVDLEWEHFCSITLGYSIAQPGLHRVCNHQFRSIQQLLARLRELGYRRPCLALPKSLDDRVLHQWLGGFLVDQTNFKSAPLPVFLRADEKWMQAPFARWLNRYEPDVVIGQQKELFVWIEQSGRRIPQDIGFAHLDCSAPNGRVSGIYQNGPEVGAASADTLVAMLQRNEHGLPTLPHTLLIEGSWVQGETLKATA
jgi:LacI family transcriptional regulator